MDTIRNIQRALSTTERVVLVLLVLAMIASGFAAARLFYHRITTAIPAHGGSYAEGVIGEPRSINPILAPVNDADRDLTELIFDGLMRVDNNGEIIPALAERYAVGDDGKVYDFFLRRDATWHDGEPVTAEDVVFTIARIQDPAFRSPLRQNWAGVTVEMIDTHTVRFALSSPYAPFLSNTTVGILPRHIWSSIPATNFPLAEENIRAVGSGPYHIIRFERDRRGSIHSIELGAFQDYYEGEPYITNITLSFYPNEEAMIAGLNRGEIQGVSFLTPRNKELIRSLTSLSLYNLQLPRYVALFFNRSRSEILSNSTVRTALAHATNKEQIVQQLLADEGRPLESAIPPGLLGHTDDITIYPHDPDRAAQLLEEEGWILGSVLLAEQEEAAEETPEDIVEPTAAEESGDVANDDNEAPFETSPPIEPTARYQRPEQDGDDPVPLEISMVTSDWPELITAAQTIADQWERVGVRVNLRIAPITEMQEDVIRPRDYEILLFGEILGADPDPFSFWHSSQKKDPGLNLALYDNRDADKLLEEARQILDDDERAIRLEEFQQLIAEDLPAIFLYTPPYLYAPSKDIKGIDLSFIALPSDRFSNVHTWYIATDRKRE